MTSSILLVFVVVVSLLRGCRQLEAINERSWGVVVAVFLATSWLYSEKGENRKKKGEDERRKVVLAVV